MKARVKLVSGCKVMVGCANRRGGPGWQGMGTEMPPPSGRHKAVHVSVWYKALETGESKPCTRKERAGTEGTKEEDVG